MKTRILIALVIVMVGLLGAITITAQVPQPQTPEAALGSAFTIKVS